MNLDDKIDAFAALGNHLNRLDNEDIHELSINAGAYNNWFTPENVKAAIDGIVIMLQADQLKSWISSYALQNHSSKKVGVVMAGNIPAVGFHDFLAVLISGHQLHMKLSHQDPFLLKYLSEQLVKIAPEFNEKIFIADQLKQMDAMIATGSDNTARYFEYYFSKIPHIIRKNRTSCAILDGNENTEELRELGKDVFQYYGLGCRNVSKIFVPADYDLKSLIEAWSPFETVIDHHKYHNNYDYNKSIYLVNIEPHLDSGFLLLRETKDLVSPISVLYYERYKNLSQLKNTLDQYADKLQCIIGKVAGIDGLIEFGKAQCPNLNDYADNVDTLKFLTSL